MNGNIVVIWWMFEWLCKFICFCSIKVVMVKYYVWYWFGFFMSKKLFDFNILIVYFSCIVDYFYVVM